MPANQPQGILYQRVFFILATYLLATKSNPKTKDVDIFQQPSYDPAQTTCAAFYKAEIPEPTAYITSIDDHGQLEDVGNYQPDDEPHQQHPMYNALARWPTCTTTPPINGSTPISTTRFIVGRSSRATETTIFVSPRFDVHPYIAIERPEDDPPNPRPQTSFTDPELLQLPVILVILTTTVLQFSLLSTGKLHPALEVLHQISLGICNSIPSLCGALQIGTIIARVLGVPRYLSSLLQRLRPQLRALIDLLETHSHWIADKLPLRQYISSSIRNLRVIVWSGTRLQAVVLWGSQNINRGVRRLLAFQFWSRALQIRCSFGLTITKSPTNKKRPIKSQAKKKRRIATTAAPQMSDAAVVPAQKAQNTVEARTARKEDQEAARKRRIGHASR